MAETLASKHPDEVKDYSVEWDMTDTITSSSWAAYPVGLTIGTKLINGLVTTAYISGGVAGDEYMIVNTIETNSGRKLQASFNIMVEAL